MASLASVARDRKNALKQIVLRSRKLDAKQEALEREVLRIVRRKKAIPEVADMQRILLLADASAIALNDLVSVITSVSDSFASN